VNDNYFLNPHNDEINRCPHCSRRSSFDSSSGELCCPVCGLLEPPDYARRKPMKGERTSMLKLKDQIADWLENGAFDKEPPFDETYGILQELYFLVDDLASAFGVLEEVQSDHPLTITQALQQLVQMQKTQLQQNKAMPYLRDLKNTAVALCAAADQAAAELDGSDLFDTELYDLVDSLSAQVNLLEQNL